MTTPNRTEYSVLYGPYKPYKKHKQWTDDGFVIVSGITVTLENSDSGKILSTLTLTDDMDFSDGSCLVFGSYECEIQELVLGRVQTKPTVPIVVETTKLKTIENVPLKIKTSQAPVAIRLPTTMVAFKNPLIIDGRQRVIPNAEKKEIARKPLYDITTGYVLPRPPTNENGAITDVVMSKRLMDLCRPHQLEGVSFLYNCIMGYRDSPAIRHGSVNGAILADEMGLGKTLQCIALIHILLEQGPHKGKPVIKKALIITPSSLTENWVKEFKKWLGQERIRVYAVDNKKNTAADYVKQSDKYPVLIISYEMFTQGAELLNKQDFGLLICDEGHRLKNPKGKVYEAIRKNITTERKIILSGTPLQNDLKELYALVNFVNPGVLGKSSAFSRKYEEPIKRRQEKFCSEDDVAAGDYASIELKAIVDTFTIRRTSEAINKFLPSKTEYVICCKPSPLQIDLYNKVLSSNGLRKILLNVKSDDKSEALFAYLSKVRKLCNHPLLLVDPSEADEIKHANIEDFETDFPPDYEDYDKSGKFVVVSNMLKQLKTKDEKIVLVSSFTTCLNILQKLCEANGYKYCRLDGSTNTTKRQPIVDEFNSVYSQTFVFLLSTKAGGVGLNLIGASRLVLMDLDWNPAHDIQAMARIWRDGQKKEVFIYRLLTTGTIEEKIFQRQMQKQSLSGSVVDKSSGPQFSTDELKDLFTLSLDTDSTTHDMLNCECAKVKGPVIKKLKTSQPTKYDLFVEEEEDQNDTKGMAQLKQWDHYHSSGILNTFPEEIFSIAFEHISFIFRNLVNHKRSD